MPPRLARLLALVAALALIAGAFAVRALLTEDGSGSDGGGSELGRPVRLLCDADLGDVCDLLLADARVDAKASRVARAGAALALLAEEEVAYDAWLTLDPWPQMADVARGPSAEPLATVDGGPGPRTEIASTRLATLAFDGDVPCQAPASWDCLAEAAPSRSIGIADLDTAFGALTVGHAAAGLVGSTDFGIDEVRDTDVGSQLSALVDDSNGTPMADLASTTLTQRGIYAQSVVASGLASELVGSARGTGAGLVAPALEGPPTIGVVLAGLGPDGAEAVAALEDLWAEQTVGAALADLGFDGKPAPTSGLPDPDVLYALREELL